MKIMLDLFSGLGGAHFAFQIPQNNKKIWKIYSVEKNKKLYATHHMDIVQQTDQVIDAFKDKKIDFLWASPPCDEFSLAYPAPRSVAAREGVLDLYQPDMKPLKATLEIIAALKPRYWAIENVQGAIRYFEPYIGRHRVRLGSIYLWGNFPVVGFTTVDSKHKQKLFAKTNANTENRSNVHAKTPLWVSDQVRIAVQYQMMIDDFAQSYTKG